MVAEPNRPAHLLPLPVAAFVLTPLAREALLPSRQGTPWRTARWLDRALERLDLSCLAGLYRRRGSVPCSPVLMLKLALFCIADGRPSPSDWAEMANRDAPCRWLVWGLEPSVSVCYAFRDRLGEDCLFEFNRQVLALAQSDGLSPANRGALDNLSGFVHGDAIDTEKPPRFFNGKGDGCYPSYRHIESRSLAIGSPGNAEDARELSTAILFVCQENFENSQRSLAVACKRRAG